MSKKLEVQITGWTIENNRLFGEVVDHPEYPKGRSIVSGEILSHKDDIVETPYTTYKLVGRENVRA